MRHIFYKFSIAIILIALMASCQEEVTPDNNYSSLSGNDSTQNVSSEYLNANTYLWENEIVEPIDDYYSVWLDKAKKIHTTRNYAKLTHQMRLIGQTNQRIFCIETYDRYFTQADRYIGNSDSPIYRYPAEDWETFDTTYHLINEDTILFKYQVHYPAITFSFVEVYLSAVTIKDVADYYDYHMMIWDSGYPPHGEFIANDSISIEMYGVTTNKIDTICRKFAKQ